jgi:DNA-binding transcriptional LysR family regulator
MRYLVAVAEAGSISGAAERLHMTQPPLSIAVAQLEKKLGTSLLERHARGVQLTPAGHVLVERARRLLAEVDELGDAVRAVGDGSSGQLTLGVVPSSGWGIVPELLRALVAGSPAVEVELLELPPSDVLDLVRGGRLDAGIVASADTGYLRDANAADLCVLELEVDELVLVMPSDHPARADVVDLADFASDRWVLPLTREGYPGLADLVQHAWRDAAIAPPRARNVATLQTALPLVEAGLAVTVAPAAVASAIGPGLATGRLRQQVPPLEFAVAWRRHEEPSPVLAALLGVARERRQRTA